jgi:hypothetical protein
VLWSKGPVPSVVLFRTVQALTYTVLILEVADMRRPIETNAVYFLGVGRCSLLKKCVGEGKA